MENSAISEIYLDHNSTAPIDSALLDVMRPYLTKEFGNPSSRTSARGERAREALEMARNELAKLVGARLGEIVFTSGGTEACFAAMLGAARAQPQKKHLVISSVEHPAVYETAELLHAMCGIEATIIGVDENGALNLEELTSAFRPDTLLVSCMLANNETGVLLPVAKIAELARERGIVSHTDAVQAVGKEQFTFEQLGVDLLSLSAHKFGGIKGCGALVVRTGANWEPVIKGGGQESGRRGGTEAVALVVAMGEAARIRAQQIGSGMIDQVRSVRDLFEMTVVDRISNTQVNARGAERLCNTSSIQVDGVIAQDVIAALGRKGIVVSAGSACKAASPEPSKVLKNMGLTTMQCMSTFRFSFGPETTRETTLHVIDIFSETVAYFRAEAADQLAAQTRA